MTKKLKISRLIYTSNSLLLLLLLLLKLNKTDQINLKQFKSYILEKVVKRNSCSELKGVE